MTLKTGVMILKIQLCITGINYTLIYKTDILKCNYHSIYCIINQINTALLSIRELFSKIWKAKTVEWNCTSKHWFFHAVFDDCLCCKVNCPSWFLIHCNVFVVIDAGTARSSPRGLWESSSTQWKQLQSTLPESSMSKRNGKTSRGLRGGC